MINSSNISDEIIEFAEAELARTEQNLPTEADISFVLLTEITRIYDFLHFGQKEEINKLGLIRQEVDVIKLGWNLGTSILFKSTKHFQGIPVMESTKETRTHAISLLYQLGCIVLLRRTSDMLKSGALTAKKAGNTIIFSANPSNESQYLDAMEPEFLYTLEKKIEDSNNDFYKNWRLVNHDDLDFVMRNYGSFMSKQPKDPFSELKVDDIESKMTPLVRPWNMGKGIMMGYDTTEEIDWHFMSIATHLVKEWRDEAGLHPELKIGNVTFSNISAVVLCLTSFNIKHIQYSKIAAEKHKSISIPQSLTIWCPLSELIEDITEFTQMDKSIVTEVFKIISLNPNDSTLLRKNSSLFMPFIIDLENDYVLRPVSSIVRNPLNSIKDLIALRNPKLIPEFTKNRESWMREYLYAMFMGTRYIRVPGNVRLRANKKDVTDIDAAIFDITTGELALFQIKWQDYHFNDVKKLRSKASNLTKELDKWTQRVTSWIETQGVEKLAQNLRLPSGTKIDSSKILLFGVSKDAARMRGYGFELSEKNIAVGTWAQFQRNRMEIGPSESVFKDLFKSLKEQEHEEIKTTPIPVTFKVNNREFKYEDLWSTFETEEEND